MYQLTLTGEPKSTQHIYGMTCSRGYASSYMKKEGVAIKADYIKQTAQQWPSMPLQGPVSLSARFFFKTRRKGDIDNFNKLWMDSLTGIVYGDDSQIVELLLQKDYDKKNPRIEIVINPL